MFDLFFILLSLLEIISAVPVCESIYSNIIDAGNNMVGIIGGEPATIYEAPYQALVRRDLYDLDHYCGASIIHKRALLTAAHCLDANLNNISQIQYWYGGIDRTNLQRQVIATKVIIHPEWELRTVNADIAVVILANDIELSSNVKIIKLADKTPLNGTLARLTGWGLDGYGAPTLLQRTKFSIIYHNECQTFTHNIGINVTKSMLCAQSHVSSAGGGDSGGPLVVGDEQIGIVSFATTYNTRSPTDKKTITVNVFADVAVLKPWIEEQIVKYVE